MDGLYCYVVMPYGLKNALPTFVRAMSKTFGDLIRDRIEIYVDDIVVKTKRGSTLVEDLTLVFDKLRATRTKLNPEKCVFGISAGCWDSWFRTEALKQTRRRSKQLRQ
jgi:hypothetical protein